MIKPTAREAAEFFHYVARQSAEKGDRDIARFAYRNSVQSWYEATVQQPAFVENLRAAEEDFSEFAKNDPKYRELLKIIKAYAVQYPGINESVLFTILDHIQQEDISYVLHFAQKHGELFQSKKGDIFHLKLPPTMSEHDTP